MPPATASAGACPRDAATRWLCPTHRPGSVFPAWESFSEPSFLLLFLVPFSLLRDPSSLSFSFSLRLPQVFPSYADTKADMVVAGVLPIDRLTDVVSPMDVIGRRIPRSVLEATYGALLRTAARPLYPSPTALLGCPAAASERCAAVWAAPPPGAGRRRIPSVGPSLLRGA